MDFIQLNKFTELHDGEKIIFCKTDFIFEEFEKIKKLGSNVVLITGNSDYPITDYHISKLPSNVIKWYAQNALSNNPILNPLPIGLENKLPSVRLGHGIGYFERVSEKENLLLTKKDILPQKFIYSNFNVSTNFNQRIHYKNISINCNHIDWEENNLSLSEYFNKMLEYKMILCPVGNGVDTHRLWETLYSNRIPITVKVGNYKIYELYKQLPIIILDRIDDLFNYDLINEKYKIVLNGNYNSEILDYTFWKNEIKNYYEKTNLLHIR